MLARIISDRRGASAIEYAVVAALIAVFAGSGIVSTAAGFASSLDAAGRAMTRPDAQGDRVDIRESKPGFMSEHR